LASIRVSIRPDNTHLDDTLLVNIRPASIRPDNIPAAVDPGLHCHAEVRRKQLIKSRRRFSRAHTAERFES